MGTGTRYSYMVILPVASMLTLDARKLCSW